LLVKSKARKTFKRAEADSASLIVHRDNTSLITKWTDNLSKISAIFEFDQEILSSPAYERALRVSWKDALRQSQRPRKSQKEGLNTVSDDNSVSFMIMGDDEDGKAHVVNSLYDCAYQRTSARDVARCRRELLVDFAADAKALMERMKKVDDCYPSRHGLNYITLLSTDWTTSSSDSEIPTHIVKAVKCVCADSLFHEMSRESGNHWEPKLAKRWEPYQKPLRVILT
jgi:hypothetical protein